MPTPPRALPKALMVAVPQYDYIAGARMPYMSVLVIRLISET